MEDATALAADIAAGQKTPLTCMQSAIERIERFSYYGATVRVEAGLGLTEARLADSVPISKRGLFQGIIPFLAKDLGGYSRGLMPCAGNSALRSRVSDPDVDDVLFSKFRAMGLIPFGLTTTPEFGLALTSETDGHAPARNPFDPTLSAGGSSGGAAIAVALGIVPIAHSTDAAGSTRVPAACCGLVGLKASRHRVPGAPHYNNHLMGLASELVVSLTTRDTALVFNTVKIGKSSAPAKVKKVGIAVPNSTDVRTADKMDEVVRACSNIGLATTKIILPDHLGAKAMEIAGPILAASLASWIDATGLGDGDMSPFSWAVVEQGRAMSASELFDKYAAMVRFGDRVENLFDDIDALIMTVLADGPPVVGAFDKQATDPQARFAQMEALAPCIAVANVAGLPALAMPFGMMLGDKKHLPFGFQIMGPTGSDEALLQLAASLEAIAPPLDGPHPRAGTT